MNILFLTRRFWPDIGGVETHVFKVAENLINEGHTVTIVSEMPDESNSAKNWQKTPEWQSGYMSARLTGVNDLASSSGKSLNGEPYSSTSTYNGSPRGRKIDRNEFLKKIIIHRLPKVKEGRTKKLIIWKWFWQHKKLFQTADVIHCHDVFFWYLPFKFFNPRKKVYITFHGYEGVYPPSKKAVAIRKISELLADGNICVGDYIKKWYGTRPDFVTYGGVERSEWRIANGEWKRSKKKGSLKILFLGRLEEDTGVYVYLAGLEELKKRGYPFTFEACGDGSLRGEVEKYGKVHGFVVEPGKYIHDADIVFTSSYLSILQAMAHTKLVLAVYSNPLKEDYLRLAPFSRWIKILSNENDMINFFVQYGDNEAKLHVLSERGQVFASQQTWKKVTDLYVSLWTKVE